ncbi:MAG: QueT transporter family protein [Ruminococcus sp.]|nr:QueT transporter family protein [Candidatus Copronaster equi]
MNEKKTVNHNKSKTYLVHGAIIAALYALLTYAVSPLSFGLVQFRFSEALCVLPVLTPAAIPGLTIGCLISNLSSPYGIIDIVFGTFATLVSALLSRFTRKVLIKKLPLLSLIFPVLINSIVVGAELAYLNSGKVSFAVFLSSSMGVALGEAVVCYLLGLPLLVAVKKSGIIK